MGMVKKDGFNFSDGLNSDFLVVESEKIESYLNYIQKNDIRCIMLNDIDFRFENINFLKECPNIEKLNISSSSIEDLSALNYLNNLKQLYLGDPRSKIDISSFKQLEELSIDYNKNVFGIEKSSSLKILRLWKYKPKSKNLEELTNLKNLEELVLTESTINSLKGCASFKNLKKLELNYINKLEDIEDISNNSNTLKELTFESCKKIKNHNLVSSLKELENLSFVNCGEIPSIGFVRNMAKLKWFIFMGTNVLDGDLTPCIGLEYVAFNNRKHFSHKMEELNK